MVLTPKAFLWERASAFFSGDLSGVSVFEKAHWCPGWESNPHEEKSPEDFKSSASAIPPPGHRHYKSNEDKQLLQHRSTCRRPPIGSAPDCNRVAFAGNRAEIKGPRERRRQRCQRRRRRWKFLLRRKKGRTGRQLSQTECHWPH